jgi:cobalamin biosynthesis Mg chelatase CobN
MYKNLQQLLLLLAILIIASSCNNSRGISITKRHYSKGNYVSVNKKLKSKNHHKNEDQWLTNNEVNNETEAKINESTQEETVVEANAAVKVNQPIKEKSNRLTQMINSANQEKTKEAASNSNDLLKVKKGNKIFQAVKAKANGEARSLFWLVITILLIIWLVALISGGWGLGGLVNILLLIALILFILWLLRLI